MVVRETTGILRYNRENAEYRCVAEIEQSLSNYYRALMPNWLNLKRRKELGLYYVSRDFPCPNHMTIGNRKT